MNHTSAATAFKGLRGLFLALACVAGTAQAAVYTSVWDPAFGAPFANLGWRGNAAFAVPNACTPSGTADIINATACAGAAVVTHAEVELYDVNESGQPTLVTLDLDEATLVIGTLRYVGGALTQLTTSWSDAVLPGVDLTAFGVSASTRFFLEFTLGGPRLGATNCSRTAANCETIFNDGVNFPPRFEITQVVSEPASIWLAGLAVLGLAQASRRRALKVSLKL